MGERSGLHEHVDVGVDLLVDHELDIGLVVDAVVVDDGIVLDLGGVSTRCSLLHIASTSHDGARKRVCVGHDDSSSHRETVDLPPRIDRAGMIHAKNTARKHSKHVSNAKGKEAERSGNGINEESMVNDTTAVVPLLLKLSEGVATSP